MRTALIAVVFAAPVVAAAADSPAAEYARGTQLATKVDLDSKAQPLRDFLKTVAAEVERKSVRTPKFTYAAGVDRATPVTYSCAGKTVAEVLDEVLKGPGLGYVVVSADGEKYDGFLRVAPGAERGTGKGTAAAPPAEPKMSEDDKLASARLAAAKGLLQAGKAAQAKPQLTLIAKKYPDTAAGKEAAALLEKLDK